MSRSITKRGGAGVTVLALFLATALLASCAKDEAANQPTTSGTSPTGVAAGRGAQPDITQPSSGPPKTGGTLNYALEAETSTGFLPTTAQWAISGTVIGMAIFDPLSALDDKGAPQPYLAESWKPSADFKTWQFKLRSGIKFHDGAPLDAAAVKTVYEGHLKSGLTRAALGPLQSIEVIDTLTVQFNMSTPWAVFPVALTGQAGVIAAPSQMEAGAADKPVGTGPFKFDSWQRDSKLTVKKNADYWRKDSSGTAYPYLNEVNFRPLTENGQRTSGLQAGQLQMFHTSDGPTIKKAREEAKAGKVQIIEDRGETEEGFVMFNTTKEPFDNLNARKAVAYATDAVAYVDTLSDGVNSEADGVFTPNSPWYIDSKFPKYDVEQSKSYVQKYTQETGKPLAFELGVGGPDTKRNGEFLQQAYKLAGMDATVKVAEQGTFISQALAGNYQANLWRQFGAPDPDADYHWWVSDNAKGSLTLNFARNQDPQIDAALKAGRESTDSAVRKQAYATLQERFTADVPYVWLDHSTWAIVAANNVRGIQNGPLPDGKPSMPIGGAGFPGVHRLIQTSLA